MSDSLHVLTAANTAWIFVSASDEPRHLLDIVFAVDVLRKRGTPDTSIFIFTDHPAPTPFLQPHALETRTHSLDDFSSTMATLTGFAYVALVVGGHGAPTGLITRTGVKLGPSDIVNSIRACQKIEAGVVVLTTCYSGVFNYLLASKQPELGVVGATNLNPSLSAGVQLNPSIQPVVPGTSPLAGWEANIFMLAFFSWLRHPVDVDADGHLTLLDAYKHAGVLSNQQLREIKTLVHFNAARVFSQIDQIEKGADPAPLKKLRTDALRRTLGASLDQLYLHQEPWTLHANFARRIVLA